MYTIKVVSLLVRLVIVGCIAFSTDVLACFDHKPPPTNVDKCAVVLVDGLRVEDAEGQTETLNMYEPVIVIQLFETGSKMTSAEIKRRNGFVGTIPDSTLLKIYSRTGNSFQSTQIRIGCNGNITKKKCEEGYIVVESGDPLYNNPLEAKILVANTPARIKRIHSGEPANKIPMLKNPTNTGEKISDLDIFNVFTVHQKHVENGEPWFFIGQSGTDFNDYKRTLTGMGWVRREDVVLWSQRQAAYPQPQAAPVIYDRPDLSTPMLRLSIKDDAASNRDFAVGKLPIILSSEVGAGSFEVVVAAERTGALPGSTTDDLRQRFWQLLAAIEQRDVLFVIDNTRSMTKYRQPVIDGITEFVNQSSDRDKTQYAFAFFGDRFNSNSAGLKWGENSAHWTPEIEGLMQQQDFFQFDLLNFSPNLPTISKLKGYFGSSFYGPDPQHDPPEMGLAALDLAIQTATWRSGSDDKAVRVVVYIGDDRDRDRMAHVAQTAKTLAEHNVILIAMNVVGDANDDFNREWLTDVKTLKTEVDKIRNRGSTPTKAFVYPPISIYAKGANDELTATRETIRDNLLAFFTIGSELGHLDPRDFVSSGNTVGKVVSIINERLQGLNLPSGTFLSDFLAAQGLNSDVDLAQFYATNDTVKIGYLPRKNANLYVTLTPFEHGIIKRAMESVCQGMSRSDAMERNFRDTARELATAFLGEELEGHRFEQGNEAISTFFRRILHLPADYFSIFGERTVAQFIDYVRSEANRPTPTFSAIHKEVCLSAKLLETISSGEYATRDSFRYGGYKKSSGQHVFERVGAVKAFDWTWGPRGNSPLGDQMGFFFVPQEFFPQNVTR